MATFVLVYRGGEVPADQADANVAALDAWVARLGDRHEHHRTVVFGEVHTLGGGAAAGLFGFSEIEATDADAAKALVEDWPEFQWGGAIEMSEVRDER